MYCSVVKIPTTGSGSIVFLGRGARTYAPSPRPGSYKKASSHHHINSSIRFDKLSSTYFQLRNMFSSSSGMLLLLSVLPLLRSASCLSAGYRCNRYVSNQCDQGLACVAISVNSDIAFCERKSCCYILHYTKLTSTVNQLGVIIVLYSFFRRHRRL